VGLSRIGKSRRGRLGGPAKELIAESRTHPRHDLMEILYEFRTQLLFQFPRSLATRSRRAIMSPVFALGMHDPYEAALRHYVRVGVDLFGKVVIADGPKLVEARLDQFRKSLAEKRERFLQLYREKTLP
jgi:hypothetical protein